MRCCAACLCRTQVRRLESVFLVGEGARVGDDQLLDKIAVAQLTGHEFSAGPAKPLVGLYRRASAGIFINKGVRRLLAG